jgi:hypothetical protein
MKYGSRVAEASAFWLIGLFKHGDWVGDGRGEREKRGRMKYGKRRKRKEKMVPARMATVESDIRNPVCSHKV